MHVKIEILEIEIKFENRNFENCLKMKFKK